MVKKMVLSITDLEALLKELKIKNDCWMCDVGFMICNR
jgi:hypothetical protein